MKATEQYFPLVLFIMLCKVVLTFESEDESLNVTIQLKATEQFFLKCRLFFSISKLQNSCELVC